jgi:hypothetical protein
MKIIKIISVNDINEIVEKISYRQENYTEDLRTSIGVVLMNYGDGEVRVKCIGQEWSGTKSELGRRDGVPLCPNGHALFETSVAPRLALLQMEE